MRNFKKIATVAALLALAVTGAAFALEYYSDPYQAAELDTRAERTRARYETTGYTQTQVTHQQYYYLVEPTTPYVYGTYTYTYSRPCEPTGNQDVCLGTDVAEVTVEVSYADRGYFVSRITTEESTVW